MRIPFPLPPSLCVSAVSQESLLSGGGHIPGVYFCFLVVTKWNAIDPVHHGTCLYTSMLRMLRCCPA